MAEGGEPQGSFFFLIQAQEEHAICLSAHFHQIIFPLLPVLLGCLNSFYSYAKLYAGECQAVCRGPIFSSSVDRFHCLIPFFLVLPCSYKSEGFSSNTRVVSHCLPRSRSQFPPLFPLVRCVPSLPLPVITLIMFPIPISLVNLLPRSHSTTSSSETSQVWSPVLCVINIYSFTTLDGWVWFSWIWRWSKWETKLEWIIIQTCLFAATKKKIAIFTVWGFFCRLFLQLYPFLDLNFMWRLLSVSPLVNSFISQPRWEVWQMTFP